MPPSSRAWRKWRPRGQRVKQRCRPPLGSNAPPTRSCEREPWRSWQSVERLGIAFKVEPLGLESEQRQYLGGSMHKKAEICKLPSFCRIARDLGIAAILAAVADSTLADEDRADKQLPQSTISARQHFFGIENVNAKDGG